MVVRHIIHCLTGIDAASGGWVAAVEAEIAALSLSGNQQLTDNNRNAGYTLDMSGMTVNLERHRSRYG